MSGERFGKPVDQADGYPIQQVRVDSAARARARTEFRQLS